MLNGVHHVAIIVSDYKVSKAFYCETLGLIVLDENYRAARDSWKLDLGLPGGGRVELFSFPNPPDRVSRPEAAGLRHLAFTVSDLDQVVALLIKSGVEVEDIRVDEFTGARFTFCADPDGLPIEFYEEN